MYFDEELRVLMAATIVLLAAFDEPQKGLLAVSRLGFEPDRA
jgi:hypothetical protein